jgi:two-component system sensor histidine kinase AgrC
LFIFTLIVFSIIYIRNKNRYKELKESYDNLFDHACLYEEELEKDTLLRHEYKNQLAVIKGLTKSKKVSNHINQILESNKKEELINIKGLNNLPKGGLRGLFYYKITTIRKNNIDFSIDISKNVKGYLSKIALEDMKTLTYILGIFCDNAIEECIKDKKSNISIEMYYIDKEVHVIVSNSIIDKIDLDKIGTRGYSTKGKNRGNGLYLIKKMLQKEEKMYISTKIINNYLIQSLKIRL